MAPSAGHVCSYIIRNLKVLKSSWERARQGFHARIIHPSSLRPQLQLVGIYRAQPTHPVAVLKQLKSRLFSSSFRDSGNLAVSKASSSFRKSRPSKSQSYHTLISTTLPRKAGFASSLRPNLTGGVLNRTARGYSFGSGHLGGARLFSHGPAAPAEVVQNVSQAVRAFLLSGQKAHYNGIDRRTGEKQFRAVTPMQDATICKAFMLHKATPGSYVDFCVSPNITALATFGSDAEGGLLASSDSLGRQPTLNTEGLLEMLSTDFSRTLKDLAIILDDLKRLSTLGDLPLTLLNSLTLRVRFPGCDAAMIEVVCHELGIQRGVVGQDPEFDSYAGTEMALLFPFAPSKTPSEEHEGFESDDNAMLTSTRGRPMRKKIEWVDMVSSNGASNLLARSENFTRSGRRDYSASDDGSTVLQAILDELCLDCETVASDLESSLDAGNDGMSLEHQDNRTLVHFIRLLDASKR